MCIDGFTLELIQGFKSRTFQGTVNDVLWFIHVVKVGIWILGHQDFKMLGQVTHSGGSTVADK
jgi:hypothetical protein